MGYVDGMGLYRYLNNSPLNSVDFLGYQGARAGSCPPMFSRNCLGEPRKRPGEPFMLPPPRKVPQLRNLNSTCIFYTTTDSRHRDDAKRGAADPGFGDPQLIDYPVSAADVLREVQSRSCCRIVIIGHRHPDGGLRGSDKSDVFGDPSFAASLSAAFKSNNCVSCEIDVLGCQLHGIPDYVQEFPDDGNWYWNHACLGYGEHVDPDDISTWIPLTGSQLSKTIESNTPLELALWSKLAATTGCQVRSSLTTLAIGIRHTCVRSGARGNDRSVLSYPPRHLFDPDGSSKMMY